MNEEIIEKNPCCTILCANIRCQEIIYRDTIDKDPGFYTEEYPGRYFCSKLCALEVIGSPKRLR